MIDRGRVLVASLVLSASAVPAAAQELVLVERGSAISYLANVSPPLDPTFSWTGVGYDDALWATGSYGIGYELGQGAEGLIDQPVAPGTVSIYTRSEFTIDDLQAIDTLHIGADYDDGFVVWLNGQEVYRSPNMPLTSLTWDSAPTAHESSNDLDPYYDPWIDITSVARPLLVESNNVLAVGAWNDAGTSSDLVLVPQLVANKAVSLRRGPYLQSPTATTIHVRWRTVDPQVGVVHYGRAVGALTSSVSESAPTTEHDVELTGLDPDTTYFYAIGNSTKLLVGDDSTYSFVTSPPAGTRKPTRIWVLGDSGIGGVPTRRVRNAYLQYSAGEVTDFWIMLGDNAYPFGSDQDYQDKLFDVFPELLRRWPLWTTNGNHDLNSQTWPYAEIFTLPENGEAGGVPSGSESYYAFDYGNIHFVVLDSFYESRAPSGPMLTWLESDLAATNQEWIIAIWHHPPYSDGSHKSDTETRLVDMRTWAVPILEDHGVDLQLSGHSHNYERSYLIDGHYETSDTFGPEHLIDGGDGRADGDGPYIKQAGGFPHLGTVYTVAGVAGSVHAQTIDYPAMAFSFNLLGSLVIDVDANQLDLAFLDDGGLVQDYFTLLKDCPGGPDADADGVCDGADNCPGQANPTQADTDADGFGDACDNCFGSGLDSDTDGTCDSTDNCPDDPNADQLDTDGDGPGDACDLCPADAEDDADADGHCADVDNCPTLSNPGQENDDGDGFGDVCDICPDDPLNDEDLDGLCGSSDNCPDVANVVQADTDADGVGDFCDPCPVDKPDDSDSDGVCDTFDNCLDDPNAGQSDTDGDGIGDACDACPLDSMNDPDGDGVCFSMDNCVGNFNPEQTDSDDDGIGDPCDDAFDTDADSVVDIVDNCQLTPNPDQFDTDGDGAGDACETDDDGDGVNDFADCAPLAAAVDHAPTGIGTVRLSKAGGTTIRWPRGAQSYVARVARLDLPAGQFPTAGLACVDLENFGTTSVQADVPPEGFAFGYLVSVGNACGETGLGFASGNVPRSGSFPCAALPGDADGDGVENLADFCPLDPDDDQDQDGHCANVDNCPTVPNTNQSDSDGDGVGDACDPS